MENNTPPSKLDETIKENLSNYDAKYDSGDWSRMERMLDAAPKSITPKGSYNMAIIIGGIVLVGGFAIYKGVTSSKTTTTDTTTETPVTPIENKVETAPKPTPAPVATNTVTTTPPAVKVETKVVPEVKATVPEVKNTVAVVTTKEKIAEKKTTEKKSKVNDTETHKTQKVTVMGNEPIFGDMIDSSKGIIHKTKEKESTKKAAVEKGSKSTVGLSNLFNLNADSLRKQKEMMVKDTVK
jgi:hypothetical protein